MQKVLAGNRFFAYTLGMKEIKEKDLVRVGSEWVVVEQIDGDAFFGSDSDGNEREYKVSEVEEIVK